jgi:Integrase core domain
MERAQDRLRTEARIAQNSGRAGKLRQRDDRRRDLNRLLLVLMTRLSPSLLGLARVVKPATILRSPWQNPYAERLIGTLRRDCLDHVLIFGARHLQRTLTTYSSYYNESRTHLSLDKDAPLHRAAQRCGTIVATPILSGLHHCYARI